MKLSEKATETRVVRVETWADRAEFAELKKELESTLGLSARAELFYPNKEASESGKSFFAPPPYEVFFQVIGGFGALAKLAEILYKLLKKPTPKGEPRHATLKLDGKEIDIAGNWTQEELKLVLETFSKQMTESNLNLLEKTRRKELRAELVDIEKNLIVYERLVQIGKNGKGKEWKAKFREYEGRSLELKTRRAAIRELLSKDLKPPSG